MNADIQKNLWATAGRLRFHMDAVESNYGEADPVDPACMEVGLAGVLCA